jgi:hypothetical protein
MVIWITSISTTLADRSIRCCHVQVFSCGSRACVREMP